MARTRLDKTLADYVVIAISPALIMTLVGSLVFFLLEVSYRGQFETRMHWIMFWFVFAAVLVARIAIEEGREHAQFFGFAMCAVAAIAVFRFVDAVLIGWMLLAVVWWCSSKLTWDCTLIDESEDTSGEGLLQAGGFDNATRTEIPERESSGRKSKKDSPTVRSDNVSAQSPAIGAPGQPDNSSSDRLSADSAIETKQPHSPGLWVVYFSLAALPLFGVGQLFIPAQEASRRSYAFQLLAVYVASGIALLLTTSFLGLRRYLRQRKLEMPASMTRSWLGMGTALLASLLLLALIIPRPQGEYTLTAMIDKIDAKARQASQFALLKGDRAEGQGRRIGEQDKNAKQPGEGQPADQKSPQPPEKGQPGGKTPGNAQTGKPSDRDGKSENKSDGKSDGDQKGKSRDQSDRKSDQNGKSDKNGKNDKESGQSDQLQKSEPQQRENQPQRDNEQKRADQNRRHPLPAAFRRSRRPRCRSSAMR